MVVPGICIFRHFYGHLGIIGYLTIRYRVGLNKEKHVIGRVFRRIQFTFFMISAVAVVIKVMMDVNAISTQPWSSWSPFLLDLSS